MPKQPFFTIITPLYKGEAFLEQTLSSIKCQTFTDFECLVVNDGSPGVTKEGFLDGKDPVFNRTINFDDLPKNNQAEYIFQKIVGNDSRFRYTIKENGGQSSARNFAVDNATGQFLLNLDQDDYFLPNHLERIAAYLQLHKNDWNNTVFRYENYQDFWIENDSMVKKNTAAVEQVSKNLTFETALVYSQISLTAGTIYRETLGNIRYSNRTKGMEDIDIVYDIFLRFQKEHKKLRVQTIPVDSLMKRSHPGSITTQDQNSGKKIEHAGKITAYTNLIESGSLTFRQLIICHLGIWRFKLAKRPNIGTNVLKKILTFASKLIAFWW